MESRRRSLAKALSWRALALVITMSLAYAVTGEATFAVSIGFADSLIKIVVYYVHERAWTNVRYGLATRIEPREDVEPLAAEPRASC